MVLMLLVVAAAGCALLRTEDKDADDLNAELKWAASRPGSCWKGEKFPTLADGGLSGFEESLTALERKWFQDYQKIQDNSIYSLNQNPSFRCILAKDKARCMVACSSWQSQSGC